MMAALLDLDSQLQLASTLSPSDIPSKLRCASCNKMAVFAWKLPCCDQMICEPCHQLLANKCPVCEHSPLEENSCTEAKALRNTIRVFLKKEQVKRGRSGNQDAVATTSTASPVPVAEPNPAPQATVEGDAGTARLCEDPTAPANGAQPVSEVHSVKTAEETNHAHDEPAGDDDNTSEPDSDSSSVEIHLGDDNDHTAKPVYGPNSVSQPGGQETGQNAGDRNTDQANDASQNGGIGNNQNQGMAAFNGMGFDPASFQQMQQMMMQGGMNGMPNMNMMNMPNMGDMNSMMQTMFNGGFNNFGMNGMNGMNGMSGMNMGMGMGFGDMGFGGNFNGQMNANFGGNGYYPNGGYNQRQMHNQQYPNQYQRGFRRGNYQQRGYGRGYNRNNYYDQQNFYGQNEWSNQGEQSMQGAQPQGINEEMQPHDQQQLDQAILSTEASKDDRQGDARNTGDNGETGVSQNTNPEDATSNPNQSRDERKDELKAATDDSVRALEESEEQGDFNATSEDVQQYPPSQEAYSNNESYEQGAFHHGYPGRGRPLVRGRGGWRGRGNFGPYGPNSHAQVGAAVTLTSTAPPENAPTGPKAMREGQPAPFGGRGGFRAPPTGPASHTQTNGNHESQSIDEQMRERSRTRSRSRSRDLLVTDEKREKYRERGYSDRDEDYEDQRDKTNKRPDRDYGDEVDYKDDERHRDDNRGVERSRETSVDSSRHRSHKSKDKYRSSRSHRERSKERRHRRHRSRSPEYRDEQDEDAVNRSGATEDPNSESSRRKSKSERHRDYDRDYEREREKRRDKDRHRDRDRSKDRKRKRSKRDRSESPNGEYYSDDGNRDHRSSRRSRKEKRSRHREREEGDDAFNDALEHDFDGSRRGSKISKRDDERNNFDERRDSRRGSKAHRNDERSNRYDDEASSTYKQDAPPTPADDVGFSILGRSNNRNKTDRPPTGPASMRPPPTGPRAQTNNTPASSSSRTENHRRLSESSNKSRPQTPATPSTPAVDPYQAEREKRNRERMAREQQRGKKQEDFAPPTGPRRRH